MIVACKCARQDEANQKEQTKKKHPLDMHLV